MKHIAVIDYGVNNVGSVANALRRVGVSPFIAREASEVERADALVLPGIGAFDAGVKNLRERGLFDAVKECAARNAPILGICLGMQLLSRGSEEGTLEGLALIDAHTRRFSFDESHADLKVPHMGWQHTQCTDATLFAGLMDDETRFYYVHSFHVVCETPADAAATCRYGVDVVAAVRRGNVFGTQFHPEKSHRFGLRVFTNFVNHVMAT